MSHDRAALHSKVRALRRTHDQLELMVHSGPADAQELWEELEKRWRNLENQLKHLTRGTEEVSDGVAGTVRDNVTELRKGYDRLASALREPRSQSLWGQVRNSLDRLVQGGHRTSDCVARSVEDLADAAPRSAPSWVHGSTTWRRSRTVPKGGRRRSWTTTR
jgi:hypothetical protein